MSGRCSGGQAKGILPVDASHATTSTAPIARAKTPVTGLTQLTAERCPGPWAAPASLRPAPALVLGLPLGVRLGAAPVVVGLDHHPDRLGRVIGQLHQVHVRGGDGAV